LTNSEKLLSSFSENYFYKELVYSQLKFVPDGGTEIELADLIINLEDVILAIQLKERNEEDRTQDKNIEEKWLKKKCKKAKEQIKDTISYIKTEKVSFVNARGKRTMINSDAEIVPLVVFENKSICKYEHLLRSHRNDGLESELNGCYEVVKLLAHLFRDEIKCFVERVEKALLIAKSKRFEIVGTLRNVKKEYAIVFTATEQGEQIPSEKLLSVVFDKQKVNTLLQVITYWINDDEYRIDFVLWLDGY